MEAGACRARPLAEDAQRPALPACPTPRSASRPHVAASALLEAGEIDAARNRAQDESKRAASELEKVRRIARRSALQGSSSEAVAAIRRHLGGGGGETLQVGTILAFSGEPDQALQPALYGVAVPAVTYLLDGCGTAGEREFDSLLLGGM